MATFTNKNFTINNFMSPFKYSDGKAQGREEKYKLNIFDSKLSFLNENFPCTTVKITNKTFLPNLSVKVYGTSSLWWVIARYNGIIYPFSDVSVGTILYIPNLSAITKYLNVTSEKTNTNKESSVGFI